MTANPLLPKSFQHAFSMMVPNAESAASYNLHGLAGSTDSTFMNTDILCQTGHGNQPVLAYLG